MYPISNAVKALFDAEQRQVLRITGTDKNGAAIAITEADVMENGFNIDRFSCNGNKLEIGTACSSELTLKLDNRQGQFNNIVFEGTELFVEIGIADWSQTNPTVTYIPCGYFTPDEQPRSLSTITIKALDRMMRFDATMPTLTPWVTQNGDVMTDSQGNIIYFVSNVQFPVTVQNLVKRVALLCGVPFTQSLSNLPNYSYTISALPTLQQEITFRNIIQWCAGIMGANAWIDWDGKLRFSWYGAFTGYTMTTANRFSSDLHEDDITITGVQYTNTQNVTIVSGEPDYAIDMTGNYLAATGIAQILPAVKNVVNGFTYRPFEASVINAPYLWPMDKVTFRKNGTSHACVLTNVNFGINGNTQLQSKGQSDQTNSGTAPSGTTTEQARLIEQAYEKAVDLDESLDQEGVFNRLTNNGTAQGIYLHNGKIYLNAEYIQTGTLVANLLMAGILTIGGANNGNGQIKILDSNGNVIGTWDKNGISVTKGSITGGTINGATLTLGGANNTSGTLTVKDASGNIIATINNNGVTVNKGSISGPSITLGGVNNDNGTLIVKNSSNAVIGTWNSSGIDVVGGKIVFNYSNGDLIGLNYNGIPLYAKTTNSNNNTQIFSVTNGQVRIADENFTTYSTLYKNAIEIWNLSDFLQLNTSHLMFFQNGVGKVELGAENGLYLGYAPSDSINAYVSGNFLVSGTKSRQVTTSQYSDRLLYCYETPSPLFGDVGEGVIGEDGLCYISLDPVFAQTITTSQYQVFLQKYGDGDAWVKERKGAYFVIQGTPGMAFGWEIKAKQKDFDQKRLDKAGEPFTLPKQTYGADAARHIETLMKERISE